MILIIFFFLICLLFFVYFYLFIILIYILFSIQSHAISIKSEVPVSLVGKSKENVSSESDSNENVEREAVGTKLDSNAQPHAKPERQQSLMDISPDQTQFEALDLKPATLDTNSRPTIHAIDSVESVPAGTPSVLPPTSLYRTLTLKSENQILPELCRRLESFSIFKESVHQSSTLICCPFYNFFC